MKRVWITGAEGHIGSALIDLLDSTEYYLLATDKNEVDITDLVEVQQYMRVNRPDVVINCASLTDVKYCEEHVDEAYRVNAIGVRNIALSANEVRAKVIQMSTDDVCDFESDVPYNEFDAIQPKTIYGKSKAAGETFLTQLVNRFVIIRSSWIYGIGKDFVDEVLANVGKVEMMEVPNNRYASPTSAKELAKVIAQFIDQDAFGLYHVVCKGGCSRYEFAQAILKYAGKEGKLELVPVESEDKLRPAYSVLDNMMLRLTGMEEPMSWRVALQEYLETTGGIE